VPFHFNSFFLRCLQWQRQTGAKKRGVGGEATFAGFLERPKPEPEGVDTRSADAEVLTISFVTRQRSQLSFSLSLSFEHHDDCIGSRRSERVG
jgi:hypothetical protein